MDGKRVEAGSSDADGLMAHLTVACDASEIEAESCESGGKQKF